MAEYFTVLKRAVSGLEPNVPEARRAIYDKARNALIGQLKAVDPPLTTAEISRQRLELEEAIRRVERETAAAVSAGHAAARQAAAPPPAERPAPPPEAVAAAAEAGPSPQDVFRKAMQEAGARGAEQAMRMERPAAPPPARSKPPAYVPPVAERRPPPPEPVEPAPEPPARDTHYREPPPAENEAHLAPEYDQDWDRRPAPPPPMPERAGRPVPPSRRDYVPAADQAIDRAERYERERPVRRSRLPGFILFVLILAMLGGLGALGWSQRAVLSDLLASFDSGDATPAPESAPAPVAATDESSKNTDRLIPGEPSAADPAADKAVRVVDAPPGDAPPAPAEPSLEATAAPEEAMAPDAAEAPPEAETLPLEAAAAPTAEAAAPDPAAGDGDALVAQKAILYEEPVGGAASGVTAINAAVTWSFVNDGPAGPEVDATIDVPDRKMKLKLAIRKNADKDLPASHLVEVVIDAPADFPGKGIRSIPRIVLKPTEESRGQPLVGAAAKVADGFFWIALSAADTDVAANLDLIRQRNWIDLPLVYETGQRAILTFEKGTPGERVFEKAAAAWAEPAPPG